MHVIITHHIHNKGPSISEFYVRNKGFFVVFAFMFLYIKLHNRAMHSQFNSGTIWSLARLDWNTFVYNFFIFVICKGFVETVTRFMHLLF